MSYIDLVYCIAQVDGKDCLRKAPAFSHLDNWQEIYIEAEETEEIEHETYHQMAKANVVDSISISEGNDEYRFICHCFNVEPENLLKVISVIEEKKLDYGEENKDA